MLSFIKDPINNNETNNHNKNLNKERILKQSMLVSDSSHKMFWELSVFR